MTANRLLLADADVAEGLVHLVAVEPRFGPVIVAAGPFGPRFRAPGYAGLARIVCGQQLSVRSADAIWARLDTLLGGVTAEALLGAADAELRAAGLSTGKVRTLRAVAEAVAGGLDIEGLAGGDPDATLERLVAIHGIGRWTADIFLLFCGRLADAFPAGDLAIQVAAMEAFDLSARPGERALRAMAEPWAPWRGVAATLLWAFYAARRQRAGIPV